MFTGLVEEMGRVRRIEPGAEGLKIWIEARAALEGTRPGDSLAVDGCCLTAVAAEDGAFAADVVPETVRRTTLGARREGDAVNLERPLRVGERLGGHWVQGHVDGVGRVAAVADEGQGRRVTITLPEALARFVAEKGSLAVDGVSLTVAACSGSSCEIAYVPHTLERTVASLYAPGRRVNLEVDLVARYVARLLDQAGVTGRKE